MNGGLQLVNLLAASTAALLMVVAGSAKKRLSWKPPRSVGLRFRPRERRGQ
jgi:hypothetical protein